MKLTVKNFGPIKEAKNIKINPMTIFVGTNNTGKSYLMKLIHSIYESVSGINKLKDNLDNSYMFVQFNDKNIDKYFQKWAELVSDLWREEFFYYLGSQGRNIYANRKPPIGKKLIHKFFVELSNDKNQFILNLTYPERSKISEKQKCKIQQELKEEDISTREMHKKLLSIFFNLVFAEHIAIIPQLPNSRKLCYTHYLPSERIGIIENYKAIITALVENVNPKRLNMNMQYKYNGNGFTGVAGDYIYRLMHIKSNENKNASIIKKYLLPLYGHFEMQNANSICPDFFYKLNLNSKKLGFPQIINPYHYYVSLMEASSHIAAIASIYLYMNEYVADKDTMIIEEPELQLHSEQKRKMAGVLAKIVNAGNTIIMTTHDDVIIEQLNNHIQASKIPGRKITRLTKLKEEDCAVYDFVKSRMGNVTVKRVPFDKIHGYIIKSNSDCSSILYNETVKLMEYIENHGK